MSSSRLGFALPLGIVMGALALGTPSTVTADDPPSEAEQLLARLRSPTFAEREAAQAALLGLGRAAAEALLRHEDDPDLDVRMRVRAILLALEILPPERQVELDRALALVRDGRPEERDAAAARALQEGPLGRRALERLLAAPAESVGVWIEGDAWVSRPGRAWKGELVIKNRGALVAFVPWGEVLCSHFPIAGGITMGETMQFDALPGLAGAIRLAPGESWRFDLAWLDRDVRGDGARFGRFGIGLGMKLGAEVELGEETVRFGVVGEESSVRHDVEVLPPLAEAVALGGATLTLRSTQPRLAWGARVKVELALTNPGTAAVRVDRDWPAYTWLATATPDGRRFSRRPSFASKDKAAPEAIELAPGEVLRQTAELPPPPTAGTWWLVGAYEIDASDPAGGRDAAGRDRGRALAAVHAFEVDAAPAADAEVWETLRAELERDVAALATFDLYDDANDERMWWLFQRVLHLGRPCAPALGRALSRFDLATEGGRDAAFHVTILLHAVFPEATPPRLLATDPAAKQAELRRLVDGWTARALAPPK